MQSVQFFTFDEAQEAAQLPGVSLPPTVVTRLVSATSAPHKKVDIVQLVVDARVKAVRDAETRRRAGPGGSRDDAPVVVR
jgi:hypothetical protein